ncbi:hypothetical protein AB0H73_39175 [Streptomyces olivoreticuli]
MEAACLICTTPLQRDIPSFPTCSACLARLQQALHRLPALYAQMHTELPHPASHAPTARPTPVSWKYRPVPAPLSMPLLTHADHTVRTVHAWALSALPRALPTTPVRPGYLLQHLCRHLARAMPEALRPPVQPDHPQAVWNAYLRALQLLQQDSTPQRLSTPCPVCDLRALYQDSTGTTCRSCHAHSP